jgi:hypothetical protein
MCVLKTRQNRGSGSEQVNLRKRGELLRFIFSFSDETRGRPDRVGAHHVPARRTERVHAVAVPADHVLPSFLRGPDTTPGWSRFVWFGSLRIKEEGEEIAGAWGVDKTEDLAAWSVRARGRRRHACPEPARRLDRSSQRPVARGLGHLAVATCAVTKCCR